MTDRTYRRGELLAAALLTALALAWLAWPRPAPPPAPARSATVDPGRASIEALTVEPGVGRREAIRRLERAD